MASDIYAETLAVFDQRGLEPLTTPEVADALDLHRRTVYKRLQNLVDRGELETKETGSNSRVWWRPSAETDGSDGQTAQSETTAERELFEAIPDGVVLHDPEDGSIIDANEQFCEMLGYSREELLALDLEAIQAEEPPHTKERALQYVRQAATEGPQTFEWIDQTKSGETFPVEVHLRRTTVDGTDCVLGVVRDITERKEQEQKEQETTQQLQGILDTVEAAIFLKDPDGHYLLMNQNYRELVGIEAEENVIGVTDEDLYPEAVASKKQADDKRAIEANETIEIEEQLPTVDGNRTLLTRKTPIFDEDGDPYAVCAVATDITERKDREQDLRASREFNEELVENAPFGLFRLDDELRITYENPRAQEIIGLPEEMEDSDALGVDIRELPSIVETGQAEMFSRLRDGETIEFEFPFESIYGKEAYFTGRGVPLYRDGEFDGAVLMANDISERRQREKELKAAREFNEELVENAPFGMFRLDEELRITYENPRAEEIIGLPEEEEKSNALGVDIRKLPPIVETGQAELFSRLKEGETIEFEFPFESIYGKEAYFTGRSVPLYRDGEFDGAVLMANDISERRQREEELKAAREFNEELVENAPFGMFRLDEELRITYENPRAEEIIGLPEEEAESNALGVDIRKLPPIIETGQAELFSRLQEGETIEFEFPFESIYDKEAYFTGRSVPLYRDGEFDGAVLMANDISELRQRQRELERQREQLAALNELNSVVRGITEAVIDQSTREEIEQVVCNRLSESDSYQFAWVASVDANREIEPRVDAGISGELGDITLSADPDDPTGQGPIASAVRNREVQVRQNVGDSEGEWRFRSAAAIPIKHQGLLYGVLAVYSERPDAFAEEEREVIGQLGEVIGHAIAAVNRKRALMSDEVIEIELRVPGPLDQADTPAAADGSVSIERRVAGGDDEYLLYGTATAAGMELLHELQEQFPSWDTVQTISETESGSRFELCLSEPPISSTVAEYGGYVESGQIKDGIYSVVLHLPPGTDIRRVVDDIREQYPDAESLRQKQVRRETQSPRHLRGILSEKLTDRQQAALEAGYYGGFFEWPRDRSGEEVATALGIGPSTFHQHVRKAERKLLDAVLPETGDSQILGD